MEVEEEVTAAEGMEAAAAAADGDFPKDKHSAE